MVSRTLLAPTLSLYRFFLFVAMICHWKLIGFKQIMFHAQVFIFLKSFFFLPFWARFYPGFALVKGVCSLPAINLCIWFTYKQETKSTDQFDVRAERMCVCKHARICLMFARVLLLLRSSGPATRDTSVTVSLRLA